MKILLTTLHAKFAHSSLALPYLAVSCRDIPGIETIIREYTINEHHDQVLKRIAAERADLVAFSCYIWNIRQTLRLASDLKKIAPATLVILGGPEVSHNPEEIFAAAPGVDCIIRGEGEESFRRLAREIARHGNLPEAVGPDLAGFAFRTGEKIIVDSHGEPIAELDSIPSPFAAGLVDMTKPLVYYETSRGCPFSCAFCMSSLEKGVRTFSTPRVEMDLGHLMRAGVGTVKLVDRTFNFDPNRADKIWDFILRNNSSSRFHFEIAADLLSEENIALLERIPSGMFRFEIGVQSGDSTTLAEVARKTNLERLFANVEKLLSRTGVTIHLDLIAGLPGEDFSGFLSSLHSLLVAGPHHIQVEPLKVLKGSPMEEIVHRQGYAFSDHPPYKILRTPALSYADISSVEVISSLLDTYYNSGRFRTVLKEAARLEPAAEFFAGMSSFFEERCSHPGSQRSAFELLGEYLSSRFAGRTLEQLTEALCYDFCLCEYPSAGNFPSFLDCGEKPPAPSKDELSLRLQIEPGSKVRTFTRRFLLNFPEDKGTPAVITFVYISAPGKGLRVEPVVEPDAKKAAP